MLPAGFEPAIPGSERPQTHVLDRAATRSSFRLIIFKILPNELKRKIPTETIASSDTEMETLAEACRGCGSTVCLHCDCLIVNDRSSEYFLLYLSNTPTNAHIYYSCCLVLLVGH